MFYQEISFRKNIRLLLGKKMLVKNLGRWSNDLFSVYHNLDNEKEVS